MKPSEDHIIIKKTSGSRPMIQPEDAVAIKRIDLRNTLSAIGAIAAAVFLSFQACRSMQETTRAYSGSNAAAIQISPESSACDGSDGKTILDCIE